MSENAAPEAPALVRELDTFIFNLRARVRTKQEEISKLSAQSESLREVLSEAENARQRMVGRLGADQ